MPPAYTPARKESVKQQEMAFSQSQQSEEVFKSDKSCFTPKDDDLEESKNAGRVPGAGRTLGDRWMAKKHSAETLPESGFTAEGAGLPALADDVGHKELELKLPKNDVNVAPEFDLPEGENPKVIGGTDKKVAKLHSERNLLAAEHRKNQEGLGKLIT